MCVALNIISGYPDGSYKPEGNITRAEFTKMLCVLLNGGNTPATATNATPTFSDIRTSANASWAEGFIEYCYAKGIVSGIGDGKFNPNGNVTATEAAKMLLVALGYNADVESYTGAAWALKVNVQANQDGLYKDLEKIDTNAALTRDNAAQMVWNALQAYVIDKSSSIDRTDGSVTDIYTKSKDTDLLQKMYKGIIKEGTLISFDYNSKDADWDYVIGDVNANNEASSTITITSKVDFTALLGQNVKGVYKYDTNTKENVAYGIFAEDSVVLFTGLIGDLPSLEANDDNFKFDGVKYKMDNTDVEGTPVYFFQNSYSYLKDATNLNAYAGKVDGAKVTANDYQAFSAIDKDGDGKIDFIMVNPVSVEKVSYANKTEFRIPAASGYDKYTIEDVTVYAGIAKNDWVVHTYAANTADDTDVFVKAELISGKITEKDAPDVVINDKTYTLDASYTGSGSVGTTLTDAVVVNGYIFDADESGATNVTDYVVVVGGNNDGYGSTVKLLFSDNTKKVVDLNKFVGVSYKDKAGTTVNVTDKYDSYVKGMLFTYETNKDGEYTLTPAKTSGTGFDYAAASGTVTGLTNSSSKAGYISNYAIADDAVIFINYDGSSYKVISGATMKTMAKAQFTVNYVLGTDNSKTGVGTVDMAYVSTDATSVKGNDTFYAFVTGVKEAQNADKEDVLKATLWTADGEKVIQTVKTSGTNLTSVLQTGKVVEYSLDDDGYIDEASVVGEKLAIKSWDGSAMTFAGKDGRFEMDDDVVYLFIDDSEDEGVAGLTSADIDVADEPTDGVFTKNAYVVFDTTAPYDILLVVYDIDNEVDA